MTTATDNTPFTWGAGGERLTPEAIKQRRALADALLKSGTDSSPIRHWAQGLNRVAQALVGGYESRKLDEADKANATWNEKAIGDGIAAAFGGASPDVPAAGSNPVSTNPAGTVPTGGGGAAAVAPASGSGGLPPANTVGDITPDEDRAIRTVMGEAMGEGARGWKAVAGVIGNRAKGSGMSLTDVVLAKNQFEPWGSRRGELLGYDPQGAKYQSVAAQVLPILRGQEADPTGGATHFYAPAAQRKLGRAMPSWDNGSGTDIGNHRFFRLGYAGQGAGTHGIPRGGATPVPVQVASAAGFPISASDMPAAEAAGIIPPAADAQFMRNQYRDQPVFKQRVDEWLAQRGGAPRASAPALPTALVTPRQDAARVATQGGPRMVLSPQAPLYTPQQAMAGGGAPPPPAAPASIRPPAPVQPSPTQLGMPMPGSDARPFVNGAPGISPVAAALVGGAPDPASIGWTNGTMTSDGGTSPPNPAATIDWTNGRMTRSSPADLPASGSAPADIPSPGSTPVGFVIPPARPGGEPTTIPTPDDQANAPAAGVQPTASAPAAQPSVVAQALIGGADPRRLAQMIASPYASDATRAMGMLLLQQRLQSMQKDKPTWGPIGKDEYGRDRYGWIDARRQTITPYQNPQEAPSGPSAIPPVPNGADPKIWRDTHSKQLAEGAATGNFEQEAKLRAEFNKNLGTFADVHDAFGRVIASTQGRSTNPDDKSPAADISLVFGFMKMLDPGSVVREGEYATAKNAGGIPERIQNTYNKLLNGEFLTANQRQDFVNQAQRVYGQARKKAEETAGVYRTLSRGYQVDADRVVTLPGVLQAPVVAPAQAAPAAAVDALRRNPALREQFDAKYGAGSAARALGR